METSSALSIKSNAPGARLFMLGNEAIARGAIEAGVQVMGAYPGTPSTEIAETLINIAADLDIYGEWSVNEKVALGVAMGASICGVRSLSVMKHVGVNVALDLLMTATYLGAQGGLVLAEAEDPGQWSSSGEQDNRFLAEEAYLPVLEPASAQEAKDMTRDAFDLSEKFHHPFMIRSVTRISHARGDVTLGEIVANRRKGVFNKDTSRWVMLPASARKHRKAMIVRMAKIKEAADSLVYNQLKLSQGAGLGIIASGISYAYTMEALSFLGLHDRVSMLKIGTPFPLPERLVKELIASVPEILVVEELEPFVENHVKALAQETGLKVNIHGKDFFPLAGELFTREVIAIIAKLTGEAIPLNYKTIDDLVVETGSLLPVRPPSLCAGCPHRASHYAINVAIEQIKKETGVEPVRPGDIGCYCLGANEPLNAVDTSTCMGSSFDLANGMARVLDAPVVAHLGDSTFFHSGIGPMVNAVFNKTRVTMVVMDNLTTAMTGAQPNPGVGSNACSQEVPQIRPEDVARAAGVKFVEVADPYDLKSSIDTMIKAIKFEGPSVVVFRRPCSILEQREKRARREKIIPYEIVQEKCLEQIPPFCTAACPLHIDVRGYVGLVREGKYTAALKLIKEKLPFPAILGRICTHPCESQCKRAEVDEAIAIMTLKRAAVEYGKVEEEFVAEKKKEKIAVIGGGPAGMMAAYDLRKLGYRVTVFEAAPVLGGMLALGIPAYRLPRKVLEEETGLISKLGVEVKLNTRIGTDVTINELRGEYQSVFIATGAHQGRDPHISNTGVKGVVNGVDFLRAVNTGQEVVLEKRVTIIGGGNVAIDCARSCIRLGLRDVKIMYRRSREEMPAIKEEIKEAEKEGVRFIFLAVPVKILASADKVSGMECIRMHLGETDESGRKRPVPVSDSNFIVETDLVILATGEQPDLSFIGNGATRLAVKHGLLDVDPASLQTSVAGIFAGGDVITGPNNVIDALAAGRKAAISIDRYLRDEPVSDNRSEDNGTVGHLVVETAGIIPYPRLAVPELPVDARLGSIREVETGYSRAEAEKEASRCLSCGCQICIKSLGCPAIVKEGNKVDIDDSQCPGCGICAQVCPAEAIVTL